MALRVCQLMMPHGWAALQKYAILDTEPGRLLMI